VLEAATRAEARETQRQRLLSAMAHLVGTVGYQGTSVAQVIARAGVSRKTFYEYFTDKEACFLEAYQGVSFSLAEALSSLSVGAGASRSSAQLERYLEVLSRDPAVAQAFIVEVLMAGPTALQARERVNRRFADLVFGHLSNDPVVRKALIGGVNDVVGGALLAGRKNLRGLAPRLERFLDGGRARAVSSPQRPRARSPSP
jgi:AcrR family transcriptional regulator